MEQNQRVVQCSYYNYYKYHNARKEISKMNYLERKRREAIEEQNKDYYKDYWNLSLWKDENMREYQKK